MNCGRKSWLTALAVGGVMAFASGAFGSTNVFLQVRTGVGLDGTSWLKWTDKANWQYPDRGDGYANEDSLGCGYADLNQVPHSTANGRYIELPDSLSLQYLAGAANYSMSLAPVLRGDGELIYKARNTTWSVSTLGAVWLYTPYVVDASSPYNGFNTGRTEICGPLARTVLSGSAAKTSIDSWSHGLRNGATVNFNYAAYATEQIPASGVRTISDWTMDYQLDKNAAYIFTAPHGSSTNLVCAFDLTADSPFAKRETGASGLKLPVGTAVTGDGIADGTYLKRIFPDGSIELSQAATATATASLTFAAVTYKTTVAGTSSRLRAQNQGSDRTVKVNKSRAEDDFEVQVSDLTYYQASGSDLYLNIGTDSGYIPGRLRILGTYKKTGGTYVMSVVLQDCEVVPPATLSNSDANLKVSGADYTARINVDTETTRPAINASYKTAVKQVAGTLIKTGVGTWPVAFTEAASAYTGKVIVEEGTLQVLNAGATMGTVEVKAGATLDLSAGGISATQLIVEEGAIISGGVLTAVSVSGDLTKVVYKNGAAVRKTSATGDLTVNLLNGNMARMYEDGASIAVVVTNSLLRVTGSGVADILIVGGGGGAGAMLGAGGGGGGGVIYQKSVSLTEGVYSVTVGNGGRGAKTRGSYSSKDVADDCVNGEDSVFLDLVAKGGGAGGNYSGNMSSKRPTYPSYRYEWGVAGGSGGGGGVAYPENGSNRDMPAGAGTSGQGYAGAASYNRGHTPTKVAGGGGGGAGGTPTKGGEDASGAIYGSAGGDGLLVPIWGQRYWGGGGGGSAFANNGETYVAGGKGGGGAGRVGAAIQNGFDGEANTGGGGGAGSTVGWDDGKIGSACGGAGGSGVVIIRFTSDQYKVERETPVATGGKICRRGGYFAHFFTESGTFKIDEDSVVDVLVVGGGGGGGMCGGGGGAGGGVVVASNVYVKAGSYAVTVGAGGLGQTSSSSAGYPTVGGASSVDFGGGGAVEAGNYVAPGGGYGGFRFWNNPNNAGGSGGGGGAPYAYHNNDSSCWSHNAGAAGVAPYFKGGDATNYFDKTSVSGTELYNRKRWSAAGGGGGGAGGPGGNAWYVGIPGASNRAKAGVGGDGVWNAFSGAAVEYGKGGDGGAPAESTAAADAIPGADGADGLGQGGGGSTQGVDAYLRGGNGGSGLVLIRYRATRRGFMMIVK